MQLSIESGARAGMVAPDETTFAYVKGRRAAPKGAGWDKAVAYWRTLATDEGARFDKEVSLNASELTPYVTWGTNPGMVSPITGRVPNPQDAASEAERSALERALSYMALKPGTQLTDIAIDRVFIGSCTNGRLDDLRAAARVLRGYKIHPKVHAMIVPGSQAVKAAAEQEGLHRIFLEAGAEWRESGCSMCLGMNPDILAAGPALRRHQQPQLRRTPGQGRPHAPGQSGHGRRRRRRRTLHRRSRLAIQGSRKMKPLRVHKGIAVPMHKINIDTDQIIPKQFLKRIERTGYGDFLFYRLALPARRQRRALVCAQSPGIPQGQHPDRRTEFRLRLFSRARAMGALRFRYPRRNCAVVCRHLFQQLRQERDADGDSQRGAGRRTGAPGAGKTRPHLTVDLENQTVSDDQGFRAAFSIDPFKRHCLLHGLDDISLTLQHEADIEAFEKKRVQF